MNNTENKEPIYLYAYLGEQGHVSLYDRRLEGISGTGYLGRIKLEPADE
jgi:hypothetical protein